MTGQRRVRQTADDWSARQFPDHEADMMRRLGTDSTMPKRIKYKELSR